MEGRFAQINIPMWHVDDLAKIAAVGFPLMNVRVGKDALKELAHESFGSPLLMQRYCLRIGGLYDIRERQPAMKEINPSDERKAEIYENVAQQIGLPAFKKLVARDPQSKTDYLRIRLNNSNEKASIYGCILYAIARAGPKSAMTYNVIRGIMQ